jgi:hypothetical protein
MKKSTKKVYIPYVTEWFDELPFFFLSNCIFDFFFKRTKEKEEKKR